jgi:phosphatidate cytidylyltransferase
MTVNRPWWFFIVYGVVVTLAGMVGDLAESLLKRDAQIKDSGSLIPGLGGLLDVLDSLVFAAPVSFLIWVMTK